MSVPLTFDSAPGRSSRVFLALVIIVAILVLALLLGGAGFAALPSILVFLCLLVLRSSLPRGSGAFQEEALPSGYQVRAPPFLARG